MATTSTRGTSRPCARTAWPCSTAWSGRPFRAWRRRPARLEGFGPRVAVQPNEERGSSREMAWWVREALRVADPFGCRCPSSSRYIVVAPHDGDGTLLQGLAQRLQTAGVELRQL